MSPDHVLNVVFSAFVVQQLSFHRKILLLQNWKQEDKKLEGQQKAMNIIILERHLCIYNNK